MSMGGRNVRVCAGFELQADASDVASVGGVAYDPGVLYIERIYFGAVT